MLSLSWSAFSSWSASSSRSASLVGVFVVVSSRQFQMSNRSIFFRAHPDGGLPENTRKGRTAVSATTRKVFVLTEYCLMFHDGKKKRNPEKNASKYFGCVMVMKYASSEILNEWHKRKPKNQKKVIIYVITPPKRLFRKITAG